MNSNPFNEIPLDFTLIGVGPTIILNTLLKMWLSTGTALLFLWPYSVFIMCSIEQWNLLELKFEKIFLDWMTLICHGLRFTFECSRNVTMNNMLDPTHPRTKKCTSQTLHCTNQSILFMAGARQGGPTYMRMLKKTHSRPPFPTWKEPVSISLSKIPQISLGSTSTSAHASR